MNTKYIDDTISKLLNEGVDFSDYAHLTRNYKRYLDKFNKAKEIISLSNDVTSLFPLENPRELIYKTYNGLEDEDEKKKFLEHYERKKIDFNILFEFDDLDRLENHKKPKIIKHSR